MSILNYCINLNTKEELFPTVYEYAQKENVPIIDSDALNVLKTMIHISKRVNILEIGTAIGYSGLHMLSVNERVLLTTIEKDQSLHQIAMENFKKHNVQERVKAYCDDAKTMDEKTLGTFDMLFIDASKANNEFFFEKYEPLLTDDGIIIVDNILARGLVVEENITNKNVKRMARKVDTFNQHIAKSNRYASFLPVGDGLMIISKK